MRVLLIVPEDRNAAESVWGAIDQVNPTSVVVLFVSDSHWMGALDSPGYVCYSAPSSSSSQIARHIDQIIDDEGAMDLIIWPPTELGIMASARWAACAAGRTVIPNVLGRTKDGSWMVALYSGQVVAHLEADAGPLAIIPRKGSFQGADLVLQSTETIRCDPSPNEREDPDQALTLVSEEPLATHRLESARIVVSGGLGVGGAAGFDPLYQLAARLGGDVGASRAAVDAGWIEPQRQVGQTGVSVAPQLYIAVGISGAMQHLAGMVQSRHIVAINPDRNAPIFKYADVGVATNCDEVIEGMLAEIDSWET